MKFLNSIWGLKMEKRRSGDDVNGEIPLPEDIIKHIQSFLSGKEAAQTTPLSKAWYSAWLTRPNLDFNQRHFKSRKDCPAKVRYPDDGFPEFARKTLRRYEELNLKIESFKLWVKWWVRDSYSLIKELVLRAIKLGVSDLNLKLLGGPCTFVLPPEVLESEALTRLSVFGCRIGVGKVCCSRLESLNLLEVHLQGDMIFEIISRCPLIEKLVLPECMCFTNVKRANDLVTANKRMLELGPLNETRIQNVESSVGSSMNLFELDKLKYLFLERVKIGTSFFHNFSSRFPCLNDLTVHHCFGYKQVQIYSPSLESISFAQKSVLKAMLDVPRIREFHFTGSCLPSLSIQTSSTEWKSSIFLRYNRLNTSLFLQLNKFLRYSNLSRISLSLDFEFYPLKSFDCMGDIKDLPRPVVHDLFISTNMPSSHCSALVGGIFSCCRPSLIGLLQGANNHLFELLCKTFTQNGSEDCTISSPNTFGLNDLNAVSVQTREDSTVQWQPLPLKTLLDAAACPKNNRAIRFQLSWGLECR